MTTSNTDILRATYEGTLAENAAHLPAALAPEVDASFANVDAEDPVARIKAAGQTLKSVYLSRRALIPTRSSPAASTSRRTQPG